MKNEKNVEEIIKSSKKIIEFVRKRQQEEQISQDKRLREDKLSDYEKCARSTLVRTALCILCISDLEKVIYDSYDDIKNEEKKLGRKLNDQDIYNIVSDHFKNE